jgi:uncharacterized protein (TIGR03067 family)
MAKNGANSISDAIAEELKKLQGTWKQIALEKDGLPESVDEFGREPTSTFVDDTYVVTLADGSVAIKGTFKLDPTQAPKTIDWTDTFGEDAGKTFPAIYSLEGHRLIFCADDDGQERPTEFSGSTNAWARVCAAETPPSQRRT